MDASPAFEDLPPVWTNDDTASRRTPTFAGRRTLGPGGFGKQQPEMHVSRSPTPTLPVGRRRTENRQDKNKQLECFLPFKLFRSRHNSQPLFNKGADDTFGEELEEPNEIAQMDHFISETAQMMVAPHCLTCAPHEEGQKQDLFKMETLGDLMKKHKDAFQEEYTEFGPTSVWAPDPPNANSLPIPNAARKLGKFFDLRGELSTINHVRRARCRQRSTPPPTLLNRMPTPQQNMRSVTSLGQYESRQEAPFPGKAIVRKVERDAKYSPPVSARQSFPSSLQALYLPPARLDISIAEDLRYDAKAELKEGGRKAKIVGQTVTRLGK